MGATSSQAADTQGFLGSLSDPEPCESHPRPIGCEAPSTRSFRATFRGGDRALVEAIGCPDPNDNAVQTAVRRAQWYSDISHRSLEKLFGAAICDEPPAGFSDPALGGGSLVVVGRESLEGASLASHFAVNELSYSSERLILVVRSLAEGLAHLHAAATDADAPTSLRAHGVVALETVWEDPAGDVKLVHPHHVHACHTACGTRDAVDFSWYASPERVAEEARDPQLEGCVSASDDMWSLGLVLLELLTGRRVSRLFGPTRNRRGGPPSRRGRQDWPHLLDKALHKAAVRARQRIGSDWDHRLVYVARQLLRWDDGRRWSAADLVDFFDADNLLREMRYDFRAIVRQNCVGAARRMLLEDRSLVNTPDSMGWTPLHIAEVHGHSKMVDVLLEWGGNDSMRDLCGLTPVDIRYRRSHQRTHRMSSAESLEEMMQQHQEEAAAEARGWSRAGEGGPHPEESSSQNRDGDGADEEEEEEEEKEEEEEEEQEEEDNEEGENEEGENEEGGAEYTGQDDAAHEQEGEEDVSRHSPLRTESEEGERDEGTEALTIPVPADGSGGVRDFSESASSSSTEEDAEMRALVAAASDIGALLREVVDDEDEEEDEEEDEDTEWDDDEASASSPVAVSGPPSEPRSDPAASARVPAETTAVQRECIARIQWHYQSFGQRLMGEIEAPNGQWTILQATADSGLLSACRVCLEYGADAGYQCLPCGGNTPLHSAVQGGFVDVARLLIEWGAPVGVPNDDGLTPFREACRFGNEGLVKTFLELARDSLLDQACSAAHDAFSNGHVGVGHRLMAHLQPFIREDTLKAAFFAASASGHTPVVEYLSSHPPLRGRLAQRTWTSALIHACRGGASAAMILFLLQNGAQASARSRPLQRTALHVAASEGHAEVVYCLLQHGRVDPNVCDAERLSPLHLAADHTDCAGFLIEAGADVDFPDPVGLTPLHRACKHGHQPMVEQLLSQGAVAAKKDATLRTPLHVAASAGHTPVVYSLLRRMTSHMTLARDGMGRTALHCACAAGWSDIVRALARPEDAETTVGVNGSDCDGETPLHAVCRAPVYAREPRGRNLPACAKLLLEAGANPTLRDRIFHLGPVDLARRVAPETADSALLNAVALASEHLTQAGIDALKDLLQNR